MERKREETSLVRRAFFKYVFGKGLSASPAGSILSAGVVILAGRVLMGCGNSKGGGGPSKNVASALNAQLGSSNIGHQQTSNGLKITRVNNNGSVVSGQNIVYTVNGQRDDSDAPGQKGVQTGDVIDLFDLINGSRTSLVVQ